MWKRKFQGSVLMSFLMRSIQMKIYCFLEWMCKALKKNSLLKGKKMHLPLCYPTCNKDFELVLPNFTFFI